MTPADPVISFMLFFADVKGKRDYQKHLLENSSGATWGTDMELRALAQFYQVGIRVYWEHGLTGFPLTVGEEYAAAGRPVVELLFWFNPREHYLLMVPEQQWNQLLALLQENDCLPDNHGYLPIQVGDAAGECWGAMPTEFA